MKVLLTADTVGGVWTWALELADALAGRGVEVALAATGAPLRPAQRGELRAVRVRRAYAAGFALEWMEDPWRDVERAGDWLLRIAAETEPDVVHLSGYAHAALPFGVPVVVTGHSDVLSWHEAVRRAPAGPEWGRYRDAVARGLAAADLLAAPTRAMLDALARLYEPPCPRLVVPNGSSRAFPRVPKEEVVLAAGRLWDGAKNVAALVHAAPHLPWPVELAGDGAVAGDNVRALGLLGRAQVDRAFARAAIFAEPARYEPFGLAALEAGRAGCALVLGDLPSLREVWGDAAAYVAPDGDGALERTIRGLIDDPRLRAEAAVRARRRAHGYSAERMADGYLDAYARALGRERVVIG